MSKLDSLVQELAVARGGLAKAKAELKSMKQELEATQEWQQWTAAKNTLLPLETEADVALREYAIALGKGQHHFAVTVQEWSALDYDINQAIEWCCENFRDALRLDTGQFEKHAKAVAKTKPLSFVTEGKEFKVKVSKDLSAYLPEEENVSEM